MRGVSLIEKDHRVVIAQVLAEFISITLSVVKQFYITYCLNGGMPLKQTEEYDQV